MFITTLILCASLAQSVEVPTPTPAPSDRGPGLLFHASFDHDRKADVAVGDPLPSKGRWSYENFTAEGGTFTEGVFGQAMSPAGRLGMYDAEGNFNPRRGTLAFFYKHRNKPYKYEPIFISTVDSYYWLRYLRIQSKNGTIDTSIANEIYRPRGFAGAVDALPDDTWCHIAVVWDQAHGITTYRNGEVYASNWEDYTWLAHGVGADRFWMHGDPNVTYDELYVFDRVLTQTQIQNLMRENRVPSSFDALPFDDARRRNRLEEFSWVDASALPVATADTPAVVKQVVPLKARAVLGECNLVFDGKLGNGFPAIYGYKYANGNGLHVQMPQPFDYVMIEGYFTGKVYKNKPLLEDGHTPVAEIVANQFIHRWQMDEPYRDDWISFFRYAPEDLTAAPDKEQLLTGRINELGFFQKNAPPPPGSATTWYLGPAEVDRSIARYPAGDRAAFSLCDTPQPEAAQTVAALRYHHIKLPARNTHQAISALRFVLTLQGESPTHALRVELHDPQLPARRLMAFDYALTSGSGTYDLTFDVADRIVPADHAVWVSFAFRDEVVVRGDSFVQWIEGDRTQAIEQHIAADMPMVLSRFAELASPRPWGQSDQPETQLPKHYKLTRELFYPLALMREFAPDHPTIAALWAWTHKDTVDTAPVEIADHPSAPRWARLQRALFNRCGDVFRWWIENRQAPTGEFGDDLNDDTDFMQDMVRYAMLRDPGNQLRNAALAVTDACVATGTMTQGISTLPTDPLHAYENGTNMLPVAAMLQFGDPLRAEAVMEAARTIEERLTARDVHGRRRFRSSYYGFSEVREEGNYATDSFNNSLFAHPALYLAYALRNPRALQFVTDYADGWIDYWHDAEAAGETRTVAGTKLDGTIIRWDRRVRGFGFADLFIGALHLTDEARYHDALMRWIKPEHGQFRGGYTIGTLEAVDPHKYSKQLASWADNADLAHITVDQFGYIAQQRYVKFEATGDEAAAIEALEASLRNINLLFDAYTLGEPQNDRIWPPDMVASVMALGGSPDSRNQLFPRQYVSYEGFSDLAAWVRRKSDTALTVWLYSFAPESETGAMRVWRTPAGQYNVRFDGEPREASLHRAAAIQLTLAPGRVHELTIDLAQRDESSFWQRPDAAISPSEVTWTKPRALQVVVHNLGNEPLRDLVVALVDDAGRTVAQQTIAHLEAPVDLHPRFVNVTFADVPSAAVRVVVNPQRAIAELYELNNAADLPPLE